MTFRIAFPRQIEPEQLDQLLARGWFRMRRSMFTTRYLLDDKGLHTAIWARLALEGYTFKASLRRRLRKIDQRFAISVGPAHPQDAERTLYRRYTDHATGERPDELGDVLGEENGLLTPFDTWQVSVHDGDRLVAYSLFDLGNEAIQSIIGVYDPDYAAHGLGFGTLLLEIRFGLENGLQYHYPGYIVEGVPAFDYKRRVGALEYKDPKTRRWQPLAQLDVACLPDRTLWSRLEAVVALLQQAGVPAELRCYPPFQLVHVHGAQKRCMAQPLFVVCGEVEKGKPRVGVTLHPDRDRFLVDLWVATRDLSTLLQSARVPAQGPPAEWYVLARATRIGVVETAEDAARQVERTWRRICWDEAPTDPIEPVSPGEVSSV